MPSLFAQTDGPHGSLVLAGDSRIPAGHAWRQPGAPEAVDVQIVGKTLRVMCGERPDGSHEWFDRQRLALGEHGQQILCRLHAAVCGAGGTGSVTFAQLVHLGVGEITVIDSDIVESSNVSRILGATISDVGVTSTRNRELRRDVRAGAGYPDRPLISPQL